MYNKEIYLCLDKVVDNWRMDGMTFGQFLTHVSGYFKLKDESDCINVCNIKYAEIAADDLYVVSAIFGAYAPNDKKMVLAPVDPGHFILPWINSFSLNVCEKTQTGDVKRQIELEYINL